MDRVSCQPAGRRALVRVRDPSSFDQPLYRKRGFVPSPGIDRYSARAVPEQFLFARVIFWAAAEEESNAP